MKTTFLLFLTLALIVIGTSCLSAFAADPVSTVGSPALILADGSAVPPATTAVVATAPATAALPSFPGLPASKDAGSILIWVFASLIPWLGWAASELMVLIPGIKGNGILHAFLTGCGSVTSDGSSGKVTVDINELVAAIKGTPADTSSANLAQGS